MSKPALYLAIDQGGHASRAMMFDCNGELISQGLKEIETFCNPGNRVEHDPEELIESIQSAIAIATAPIIESGEYQITAAGLATQRSSIVCWDKKTGEHLSPVISWQDRRAAGWMDSFGQYDVEIHKTTGLFATAHYGVSKLKWCLENIPAVSEANNKKRLAWGPLVSYILFKLLDERPLLTDPANASRTLLWNIHTMDWDDNLMRLFGVPLEPFPDCVPTFYDYGHLNLGSQSVPLNVATGDQSAALYAYGIPDQDVVYINLGTGAFIQHVYKKNLDYVPRLLMSVVSHLEDAITYVLEGTVNGAGSAFVAVEEELGMNPVQAQRDLEPWLARNADVPLFLNGISGLGSPFWVADFQSRFDCDGEDWEKLVAVAESILFLIMVNLEEMQKICEFQPGLVVTGGLSKNSGICQRLSDLTQREVFRPDDCEATARGTAYLLLNQNVDWSIASDGRRFTPTDNPGFLQRYIRWKELMMTETGLFS